MRITPIKISNNDVTNLAKSMIAKSLNVNGVSAKTTSNEKLKANTDEKKKIGGYQRQKYRNFPCFNIIKICTWNIRDLYPSLKENGVFENKVR